MKNPTHFSNTIFLCCFVVLILFQSCKTDSLKVDDYNSELITAWNEKIMKYAIEEDGLLTLKGVRTEAMMFAAIHDALNAIKPLYTTYSFEGSVPNANPTAATAQAAYEVALNQFPEKQKELEEELSKWLSEIPEGTRKTEGISTPLGKPIWNLCRRS